MSLRTRVTIVRVIRKERLNSKGVNIFKKMRRKKDTAYLLNITIFFFHFRCTVCGRGFTQQIDLQRHLTRHTGEKPFKCHLCKAQFIRADNLRKHCKDAHYVNIEEPIRKRRRKTTGSDTVLPPLEVAIALALSETERNGGRVLGRATTRSSTKSTTTTTTKQQQR